MLNIAQFLCFVCVQCSLHIVVVTQILIVFDVMPYDNFESIEQDLYFKVVTELFNS